MSALTVSGSTRAGAAGASVEVARVSRSFGAVRALDDVSLDIAPGRIVVLLGPSGSGKTTLLRAIAGIEGIDGGAIRLDGRPVSRPGATEPPDRRDLGMVFQDYALWPHMTVEENVGFALRRARVTGTERRSRVRTVLERVGLDAYGERFPNELSGGQQQRVALARAVVAVPSLLLFDEPLSNLDADLRERMRIEIATLVRETGATAVYITHDQAEAFALADVIAVIESGRIVQVATPETIYSRPASRFVARFTGVAGGAVGVVRLTGDGHGLVEIAGHRLPVTIIGDAGPGDQVDVVSRSTALAIVPGDARLDPRTHGALPATVVDAAYRGAGYDHVVETPLGLLTGVRDEVAHPVGAARTVALAATTTFAFPNNC